MKRSAFLLAFTLTAACSTLTETKSEVTSLGFLIFADGPTIDLTSKSPLTRYYLDAEGNDAGSWAGAATTVYTDAEGRALPQQQRGRFFTYTTMSDRDTRGNDAVINATGDMKSYSLTPAAPLEAVSIRGLALSRWFNPPDGYAEIQTQKLLLAFLTAGQAAGGASAEFTTHTGDVLITTSPTATADVWVRGFEMP
jgi:hypothetical protein